MRTEPGATGAETDRQQRQNAKRRRHKRKSHQLLTALLTLGLDRLAAVQRKNPDEPTYAFSVACATKAGVLPAIRRLRALSCVRALR